VALPLKRCTNKENIWECKKVQNAKDSLKYFSYFLKTGIKIFLLM